MDSMDGAFPPRCPSGPCCPSCPCTSRTHSATASAAAHLRARGLHHLVVGAAPRTDVAVTKPHRHIVAKLRDLKALELPIATVLRDERFGFHRIILPLPSPSRQFG